MDQSCRCSAVPGNAAAGWYAGDTTAEGATRSSRQAVSSRAVTLSEHPSSSLTQLRAEKEIVEALAKLWNIDLRSRPGRVMVADGVNIEVDAASADFDVVVEAYARQGRLKGAQPKKIAQDILKLALLKRVPGREATRTVIAFASSEARESITGWLQHAADRFGVELVVVEIADETKAAITASQDRQIMVNGDVLADDADDARP